MSSNSDQARKDLLAQVDAAMIAAKVFVSVIAESVEEVEARVTVVQFRTLVIVAAHGPINLTTLAELLSVHASNATRSCDRLVKAGLLKRAQSQQDRRQLDLALTAEGFQVIESVLERRRAALTRVISTMPAAKRERFAQALRDFGAAAGESRDAGVWPTRDDLEPARL